MEQFPTKPFNLSDCTIYPDLNEIHTPENRERIEPKIMEVLLVLAEHSGEVVSKEQLLDTVWPDLYVTDDVVSRAVSELRKVFHDDPKSPRYIETIPKKGYRLIPQVVTRNPTLQSTSVSIKQRIQSPIGIGAIASLIFLLIAGGIIFYNAANFNSYSKNQRIIPLTSLPGEEEDPALSPEGSRLAFAWNGGSGSQNIYVKLINNEQTLQLTDSKLYEFSPVWSPDGSKLAYARFSEGIYSVSSLGGPSEKLTDIGRGSQPEMDWSPDGATLIFSDRPDASQPYRLYMLDLKTREKSMPVEPEHSFAEDHFPRYSPDGSEIAFVRGTDQSNDLYLFNIYEKSTIRLTYDHLDIEGIAWNNDGKSIYMASNRGGTFGLWKIFTHNKKIVPFSPGTANITHPAVSSNAEQPFLAFIKINEDANIWKINLNTEQPRINTFNTSTRVDKNPRFSPRGDKIAFISDRNGTFEVWLDDSTGGKLRKLTSFNGPYLGNPSWSPDGKKIIFDVRKDGRSDIFEVSVVDGVTTPIIQNNAIKLFPRYSPDGTHIYFTSNYSDTWEIWKFNININKRSRVTRNGGYMVEIQRDGSSIFYSKLNENGLWKSSLESGEEQQLFTLSSMNRSNWTLTERGIYYLNYSEGSPQLSFYDFSSKTSTFVMPLEKEGVWFQAGLTATFDGKQVLYTRLDRQDQDIMAIER